MIMLAVYYTLADIVLLAQCFYYRGFSLCDEVPPTPSRTEGALDSDVEASPTFVPRQKSTERTALLSSHNDQGSTAQDQSGSGQTASAAGHPSRVDATHLSPATPFAEPSSSETRPAQNTSVTQAIFFNFIAIALVCGAGTLGWYISPRSGPKTPDDKNHKALTFDILGQVFGYLCAILYLGSRLPQLLLNYRRKSTEGVSLLFFLFACIGNMTYVLSILAYEPVCEGGSCRSAEASELYGRYILVNLSWLIGSFGTLLLDMAIFTQFFLYKNSAGSD